MKAGSRPQYYRIRRMVQMVQEGSVGGNPPNSKDFMAELGASRRTVARDLDFLRDEERAPLDLDMRSVLDKIAESREGEIAVPHAVGQYKNNIRSLH